MLIKKSILLGLTTTLLMSTMTGYAASKYNLTIVNNTNASSTVKANGTCGGNLGKITPANQTATFTQIDINVLCLKSFPCDADVYMNEDCSGEPIAKATYILNPDLSSNVTINYVDHRHYVVESSQDTNHQAVVEIEEHN